jgi:hypothetical protein
LSLRAAQRYQSAICRSPSTEKSGAYFYYRPGKPAFLPVDFDPKGMKPEVRAKIRNENDFRNVLIEIVPELASCGWVVRASTSAGLRDKATGELIDPSGKLQGLHGYIPVADGTDIVRFLKALFKRCWLAGFGWGRLASNGYFLERSIIDETVGAAQGLMFEAPPILPNDDLTQDPRDAVWRPGGILDTKAACPDLTPEEEARYDSADRGREGPAGLRHEGEGEGLVGDEKAAAKAKDPSLTDDALDRMVKQARNRVLHHRTCCISTNQR